MMGGKRRRRLGWDEGGTLVEAALTLGALITLLVGIMEFAFAFYQWNAMLLAVQDVGRQVMVSYATTAMTAAKAQTALQTALPNATVPLPTSSTKNGIAGMQLSASYHISLLTNNAFTITSSTWVPTE